MTTGCVAKIRAHKADLSALHRSPELTVREWTQKPTFYPDNILVAHKVTQLSDKKNVLQAEIYSYACVTHGLLGRLRRLGEKGFLLTMQELLRARRQQAVVGKSDAIVVSYDYDAGKSCAWPTPMLELLVERGAERIESKPKTKL